jgi:general secretion pathway protein A
MYADFFGLQQEPFSIAPDPRYLFMSERHREALAHLLYGVGGGGGFVLLTGEIGAGKTTVCRCFLEQIPRRCNVAYIFNPKLTVDELLKSVCEEFRIPYEHLGPGVATVKDYIDPLNEFLLKTHAVGQNNVLIIDEAQNLSADVLEQLRLLTNLETNERKLLQIILIGQPELRSMLARPELEQLGQRVIARYHLGALSETETSQYIRHRLSIAGRTGVMPFDRDARERIHQLSHGIPRRINLLCDRALLGAYAHNRPRIDRAMVDQAASEVFDETRPAARRFTAMPRSAVLGVGAVAGAALVGLVTLAAQRIAPGTAEAQAMARAASAPSAAASRPAVAAAAAPPAAVVAEATASATSSPTATRDMPAGLKALPADEKTAWRELAKSWNLALGEGDPCGSAERQQVRCFRGSGSVALVRQLGRPSILSLHDGNGKVAYALLTGLNEQGATLRWHGVSQTVPLGTLDKMWRGEFATFWRAPADLSGMRPDLAAGPAADWLATQLAKAHGEPQPSTPTAAADLKSKVHAFQVAQGLKADGLVGPLTLMQLNRATGVDEPRLVTER